MLESSTAQQNGVDRAAPQREEIRFLLKLSNEHTESQFTHVVGQPSRLTKQP